MAATDQIRQMVNFILQEAHEKANEIRVKVCRHRRSVPLQDPIIVANGYGGAWYCSRGFVGGRFETGGELAP
jgi:hypothetical protein